MRTIRTCSLVLLLALVAGCTGTRAAYEAADTLDEYAYVATEQYAATLHEARLIREKPTTPPNVVTALQKADKKVQPLILKLGPLAEAFKGSQTAETQAELQAALDEAVLALADFISEVKAAR